MSDSPFKDDNAEPSSVHRVERAVCEMYLKAVESLLVASLQNIVFYVKGGFPSFESKF